MHNYDNHPSAGRRAAMLAVTAGIALLTAACGGNSPSTSSSDTPSPSTTYAKVLAYSRCMRSHGVPSFPDPTSNGVIGIKNHSVDLQSAAVKAAAKTCRGLLPNGGQPPPGQQQQNEKQLLKFSQCMRAHGVKKFPDPSSNGQLQINDKSGVDPTSSQFLAAQRACQSLNPAGAAG